ncbi:dual specificity protein phosphatase family protein [Reinekea sp.]|jgi:protein-tyrosine phosphatase|uniref:phosphatase domain-containing protein n=1 Tax=Reinekea sp. TaxID=1970455 RepID=UPI003988E937
MQHVFWLRENQLAGRSGPNLEPWSLEQIKEFGFSAILSVNDGEMVHESLLDQLSLNYACIPMSSNAPIRDGDKDQCLRNLPRTISFIEKNIEAGPVLIHCRSGKDRTGMVLAASLIVREGLIPSVAMAEVLKVRDIAFSADTWMDFGLDVLTSFYDSHKS